MPQQDYEASQLHKAEVVLCAPLVADHEATEVTEPGKQPLNLLASLVAPELAAVLWLGLPPIAPVRRDQLDALLGELGVELIGQAPRPSCKAQLVREPTSGLEPLTCSLRVCGQGLLSVAGVCEYHIDERSFGPLIARYRKVLRPG